MMTFLRYYFRVLYITMRILGIDPGTKIVGYGVLDVTAREFDVIAYGTIQSPPKTPLKEYLPAIYDDMQVLIEQFQPDVVAIEQLFFFKNAKTVMAVSQARGVILLTVVQKDLPYAEYTPLQVKKNITGHGRAEKKVVQEQVTRILNLPGIPRPDDAADALAIAICHAYNEGF